MSKASDKAKKKLREQKKKALKKLREENNYSPPFPSVKKEQIIYEKIIPENKVKKFFKSIYGILTLIVTVLGFIVYAVWVKDTYHEVVTPSGVKFDEKNYIRGVHIPIDISNSYPGIQIIYGSVTEEFTISNLKRGVAFKSSAITPSLPWRKLGSLAMCVGYACA